VACCGLDGLKQPILLTLGHVSEETTENYVALTTFTMQWLEHTHMFGPSVLQQRYPPAECDNANGYLLFVADHSPAIAAARERVFPGALPVYCTFHRQVSARTLSSCPTHVFAFMGSELYCLFRVMRCRWISVTDSRVCPRRHLGRCFNCMMTWLAVATRPCLVP